MQGLSTQGKVDSEGKGRRKPRVRRNEDEDEWWFRGTRQGRGRPSCCVRPSLIKTEGEKSRRDDTATISFALNGKEAITREEREAGRIGVESDSECDNALHRSRRLA